ncbi:MAG TPA: glutaredoxin 3 [Gammaproteobacteria bacterium]|nr:glutaredoxin 3 [Gammaproteobacteria bacterium]
MQAVTIYSTRVCGYCMRAKALLTAKQVPYQEILVDSEPGKRAEMEQKSGGRRTVPQIFVGARHVGGFDELYALERKGELDALLNG